MFPAQILEAHEREMTWLEQRALDFRAKLDAAYQAERAALARRLALAEEQSKAVGKGGVEGDDDAKRQQSAAGSGGGKRASVKLRPPRAAYTM